jgi:hypothetical protein
LSQATWLVTVLQRGSGKLSKHPVPSGGFCQCPRH